MLEIFIFIAKGTLAFAVVYGAFVFLVLPFICALFHEYVLSFTRIKVGANGKRNCSIYSEEYSAEILATIAKEDPRFSDVLMYRMRIEQARRKIRIAKRKKEEWRIKDLENMIFVNEGHLENAMEMYIKENPSEYLHRKK